MIDFISITCYRLRVNKVLVQFILFTICDFYLPRFQPYTSDGSVGNVRCLPGGDSGDDLQEVT